MGKIVKGLQFDSVEDFIKGYTELPPEAERRAHLERLAREGKLESLTEVLPSETDDDPIEIPPTEGIDPDGDPADEQTGNPEVTQSKPIPPTGKLRTDVSAPVSPRRTTMNDLTNALDNLLDLSPSITAIIRTPVATIKMPARMVSVNEFSIGFFVPIDSSAEFSMGAEFVLEIGDKKTPVVYAGGVFQLARSKYHILSFVINKETPE